MIGPVLIDVPDTGTSSSLLPNWIEDVNRFSLRTPSPWWLQLLRDYDPNLVVIPSRTHACYRLCRRLERGKGFNPNFPHEHPDTKMMIHYGLLPIRTIVPWAVQSDKIIRDLMACDMDRQGGADVVCDRLEAQELDAERKADQYVDAESRAVNRDAYRSLTTLQGSRVSLGDANRGRGPLRSKHAVPTPRTPASASASPGHSGGIILADR